jgi:hypothetical protein
MRGSVDTGCPALEVVSLSIAFDRMNVIENGYVPEKRLNCLSPRGESAMAHIVLAVVS